jgi:hypothetical protein
MAAEQPVDLPESNAAPVSAKGKSKDTKSGENSSGPAKKEEAKVKPGLVQATEAPPPPILKPPILFRSATWENYSQSAQTPPSESSVDVSPGWRGGATSISITSSPGGAASISAENEPASAARVAFGLRLTTSSRETGTATLSTIPESPTGQVLDLRFTTPAAQNAEADHQSPQISAVRITADTNRSASNSSPANSDAALSVRDLSLPSNPKDAAPMTMPDTPMSSGSNDGRLDVAPTSTLGTETGSAGGFNTASAASPPVASGPVEASSEYAGKQPASVRSGPAGERPLQGSDGDTKPVPDLHAISAPISLRSGSLADSQAANLQTVDLLSDDAGKPQAPGNSSLNTPVDQRNATAVDSPAAGRVMPIEVHPEQKPAEKSGNDAPAPSVKPAETGVNRDHPESSHNESRESSDSEPQAQASGGSDTRAGRSGADPFRATPSRAMQSQSTPSQGTTSLASSSQAAPIKATSSDAKASEAPKVANEPEINTALQAQPARQISLKLTGDDSSKVTVDLSERGGKVQVSVRTADPELAESLRGDLGDLVGRLESKGYKTEAWIPTASRHTPASAPEQSGSSNSQRDPSQSGSGADQRQGRQGQNGSNQRQQARWKAQLEETLSTEETRTNNG